LRNIFLCHLSQENNDPELAFRTVRDALSGKGYVLGEDYFMRTLDRLTPSPVYTLNDNIITEY